MTETCQQGEGEMAVEWQPLGLPTASAQRLRQPKCHQVVATLLLPCCAEFTATSPELLLPSMCYCQVQVLSSLLFPSHFSLNQSVLSEIILRGTFKNGNITYHK